jgi:hypothetical protein
MNDLRRGSSAVERQVEDLRDGGSIPSPAATFPVLIIGGDPPKVEPKGFWRTWLNRILGGK